MVGYDCAKGVCSNMIAREEKNITLSSIYGIAIWTPCIIILLSYSTIWVYVWSQSEYLKQVGNIDIKKVIAKRELEFIKTFFMVIICYFACVVPLPFLFMVAPQILTMYPTLYQALQFTFFLQFNLNVFIYTIKSDQYRGAYSYFLKQVTT
jgi:hypothetical protein